MNDTTIEKEINLIKLESYWNVNSDVLPVLYSLLYIKLESYWNVNTVLFALATAHLRIKLESYWNVNAITIINMNTKEVD